MKRMSMCAAAVAAGCLLLLSPSPARSAAQTVEHTIRSGDNLHLIAGYYYGNPREWKRIWRTNRKALSGPNSLAPGRVLRIEGFSNDGFVGTYDEFLTRVRGK